MNIQMAKVEKMQKKLKELDERQERQAQTLELEIEKKLMQH